jgi:type VI secretion system secreted protein VgrG
MAAQIDLLSISTPLPDGTFVITNLGGHEQINQTFCYNLTLSTGKALLDPTQLLDKPVTVTLGDPEGTDQLGRYINGIVHKVTQRPTSAGQNWGYELVVVPKLFFLKQTRDCRFYHNKSVVDVLTELFGTFNVTISNKLQGTYTAVPYIVQYNESYYDFAKRLMEDNGIFYFHTHSNGAHTLVLGDNKTVFQNINNSTVELHDTAARMRGLSHFARADVTVVGQHTHDDYDPAVNTWPQPPSAGSGVRGVDATALSPAPSAASSRKVYSWPAVRSNSGDAKTKSTTKQSAADALAQLYHGTGSQADFYAGGKFTLSDDPIGVNNYVIRAVSFQVADHSTGASSQGGSIHMSVEAFPAAVTWTEPATVSPPVMAGLYTGIVIGADGVEINMDDSARIQVWFPWDTQGEITPANTFWARVVQPWAGGSWGVQFIPRVGMEVAIGFMEGDVNRPVVLGAMYNANATPPWNAAKKNISGFRTHSTLNGDAASNFNELSWDDTKGSELFFLHAEKDYTTEVENNQTLSVGNCRTVTVQQDETVTIAKGNQSNTVSKGDQYNEVTEGSQAVVIKKGDRAIEVDQGDLSTLVQQGKYLLKVQSDTIVKVAEGDLSMTASQGQISMTASQGQISIEAAQNSIFLSSPTKISLAVGQNSIEISASGIKINGMQISATATASHSISGASVSVSGEGSVSISAPSVSVGA